MIHHESRTQQVCVRWLRSQHKDKILFAIPNGGRRGKFEAAILKGEGVLAGVPDLFLAHANGTFHGLFVEMKSEVGRVTATQKRMHDELKSRGYQVAVCRSLADFMECVNGYLGAV